MIIKSSNLTCVSAWSEILITSVFQVLNEDNADKFVNVEALLVMHQHKVVHHFEVRVK